MEVSGLGFPDIWPHHVFSHPLAICISRTETLLVHFISVFGLGVAALILVPLEGVRRPILVNSLTIRGLLERRGVHFAWWSNLRVATLEGMSRKSAIIRSLRRLLIVSRLVETIWTEKDNLVIAIIVHIYIKLILGVSVMRYPLIGVGSGLMAWRCKLVRRIFWELTHNRTINESLCNFTYGASTSRWTDWKSGIYLPWPSSVVVEVRMCTSLVWAIQVFNTWSPLAMSLLHWLFWVLFFLLYLLWNLLMFMLPRRIFLGWRGLSS